MDCQKLLLVIADMRRSRAGLVSLPSHLKRDAIRRAKQGQTCTSIGRSLNIAQSTVSRWIRDAGVTSRYVTERHDRLPADVRARVIRSLRGGASIASTSRLYDVNIGTVSRWAARAGIETAEQRTRRLAQARRDRTTTTEALP